jgi:hypothetical protein
MGFERGGNIKQAKYFLNMYCAACTKRNPSQVFEQHRNDAWPEHNTDKLHLLNKLIDRLPAGIPLLKV